MDSLTGLLFDMLQDFGLSLEQSSELGKPEMFVHFFSPA